MPKVEFFPCVNAPIYAICDIDGCVMDAVVDCYLPDYATWGNLCRTHFHAMGSRNPGLVNNLTEQTIKIFY